MTDNSGERRGYEAERQSLPVSRAAGGLRFASQSRLGMRSAFAIGLLKVRKLLVLLQLSDSQGADAWRAVGMPGGRGRYGWTWTLQADAGAAGVVGWRGWWWVLRRLAALVGGSGLLVGGSWGRAGRVCGGEGFP